jgi:DNA repair protein RecO (recombination protein O)
MPLQTSEAIVIGGHNLGEADRIIPFFTRRLGKVRAVAKGARRIRSRFGGTLELFTLGQLVFFEWPSRTLHKINEFAVIEPFAPLKADLDRLSRGAYIVELAAGAVEDGEPNEEIFLLLRDALAFLVAHDDLRLLRTFEIRLLRIAGYLLELYRCLSCRVLLDQADDLVISLSKGGLVCSRCQARVQDKLPISRESLAYLRSVLVGGLDTSLAAPLQPPHDHDVRELLRTCIAYFLGKTPRSLAFVNRFEQGI